MMVFSPEKANALIPILTPLIETLWAKRRELAIRLLASDPALAQGREDGALQARGGDEVGTLKGDIVRLIERIEAYGCLMKDLDLGLVDFPALRAGRPMYLCWKAGESELAHWHWTDEGFPHRKPLERR
jgi:hypothetical protein